MNLLGIWFGRIDVCEYEQDVTDMTATTTMNEPAEIILLSNARRALAEAVTIHEVKTIRDKSEAVRMYLRQQNESLEAQNYAAEIKLWSERRGGELLAGMNGHGQHGGNRKSSSIVQLDSIGIQKTESHRWQRVASVPMKRFEQHIQKTKAERKELTTAGVLSLAKVIYNEQKNQTISNSDAVATTDLKSLVDKFSTIYADPPWAYGNQATRASTDNHYPTMTPDEIAALPIADLAADNAHLHLWTTNAFLFDCKNIMEAWGFTYKSCLVWVKPQMGIGNYWRVSHEFLLFGLRGECPFLDRGQKSWIEAKRTGHSTKPEIIRKIIEKVSPSPRLELFGRRLADGWTVWGNQITRTMFDAETA